MSRIHFSSVPLAVLALGLCTGSLHAVTLVANPTALALSCDTSAGPTAGSVGITLASGSTALTVTVTSSSSAIVLPNPAAKSVSSSSTATSYSFTMAAGCAGATNGQTVNLTFTPNTGTALVVVATLTVTTPPSLSANPTSLALSCDTVQGPVAGSVGIQLSSGSAQNVTVTSSSGAVVLPSPPTKSVSSSSATSFSFSMASGCSGATNGQTLHLTFTPVTGAAVQVTVTLTVTSSASIVATPSAITLNCDTLLGPTPATIGLTLASASLSAVNVAATSASNAVVLPNPATQSVASASTATNYIFSLAAGCKGIATPGTTTTTLTFTPASGTAITVTATLVVTSSASALAPSPSAVNLTCTRSGSTDTRGNAVTVNVTSPAPGGTPFTVDNTIAALPSWLSVTPLTGGTAASTPVALTVQPTVGCGGLAVGSTTFVVHLLSPPAAYVSLPVTIEVGTAATLTASPAAVSLSYTLGTTTYTPATTSLSASPAVFFTVNPSTLPVWLNATPTSGTTTSPVTVSFAATAGAQTLAPGNYTAQVHLQVSGDLDTVIPVTLSVKDPAATLSVSDGLARTLSWTLGTALPTLVITPISSDSPIPYTVTTSGTLAPQVSSTSGIAYSFGSPMTVTFPQSVFSAAAPGAALTGSVIITPSSGSAVTVAITVNVMAPGANITSISPSALPTGSGGPYIVALNGNGFVSSGGANVQTTFGIVSSGVIVPDANVTLVSSNSTNMVLQIATPTNTDPLLPFSGNGGTVVIGVCNPQGTSCNSPTSTASIVIGINPIIQTVTSSSSYIEPTAPAIPSVSAFDILSVFGTNFCISSGAGCTGGSAILYGTTDPVTSRYLTQLSPDAAGSSQRLLTVTFQTHGASPTFIGSAPLLFATNRQINMVAPSAVSAYIGQTVDIVVSFGYGSGSTMLKSLPFTVNVAATDPGVFTVGGDGQGDAAALSATYALITQAAPAGARTGATGDASDTVSLYVTGLGVPDSATGTVSWTPSTDCMAVADYWAAVNTADSPATLLTSADGLVLQSSLYAIGNIQPCLKHTGTDVPTVTIGGVSAPVQFAGWVSGSVAGLYQINAQIPVRTSTFVDVNGNSGPALNTPLHLPVVVTANTVTSQPSGVTIWVEGNLIVTQTGATTSAGGATWASSGIGAVVSGATATGAGTYTYSMSGSDTTALTAIGLTLNSNGTVTGTAIDGTATVTIIATEATTNVTGSVVVTYTITN